jgi:hypothetical protein
MLDPFILKKAFDLRVLELHPVVASYLLDSQTVGDRYPPGPLEG